MKITFANESEVPDNLKDKAVKQDDGTYIYEGTGLVDKNRELLGENARLKELAKLVKGLDTTNMTPEKIKQALEEHEKAGERETEIQARIQSAVAENARLRQGEVDTASKKVTEMEGALQEHLLERELTGAISAEKGNPLFIAPVLRNSLKVVREVKDGKPTYAVRVVNAKGDIDLDASGNPKTVNALVQGAKKDPKFAAVFEAPAAAGSGAQPEAGRAGGVPPVGSKLVPDAQGRVTLTREQAKDGVSYREAVGLVKGNYANIVIADAPATAESAATAS